MSHRSKVSVNVPMVSRSLLMFGRCMLLILHMYWYAVAVKGKDNFASSLDIAPLTILDSGALQPRKCQLTGTGCSTAAQASGCP